MKIIQISHHLDLKMKISTFQTKQTEVIFVTIWRLDLKTFHICHQKNLSYGDDQIGFTIVGL